MNAHSLIILAAYAALIASPFLLQRFSRARGDAYGTFAVGGRDFGWFRLAAGLSATFVGGAAVINLAGLGYTYGWFGLADVLPTSLALILSAFAIVPRVLQNRGISLGSSLQVSGRVLGVATGLLSTVVYTLITAAQIVALVKVAQPYFPVPGPVLAAVATIGIAAYLLYGGYASVTTTDVIQFIVMALGYFALVGLELVLRPLPPVAPPLAPQPMSLDLILLLATPLLFVPASQDLHIRIHSARRPGDARLGVLLAGGAYLLFGFISVCVGRAMASSGVALASPDDAVPAFLRLELGEWAIIPTIAIICVVVSTLDSVLFAAASSFAYDCWDRVAGGERQRDSARPRIATIVLLAAALLIAAHGPRILSLVLSALVIYVAVLFPLLLGRWLGRRERPLGLTALAVLVLVTVLEFADFDPPFRAFLYTAVHFVLVLCLPRTPPHETTG